MSECPSISYTTARATPSSSDRRGRMPHCVRARVRDSGLGQDVRPLLPVRTGVDRPTVLLAPDEIVILPDVRSGEPPPGLRHPVRSQRRDQLRRQRYCRAAPLLDLPEYQAAGTPMRTHARVARAGRGAQAGSIGRDAPVPAAGSADLRALEYRTVIPASTPLANLAVVCDRVLGFDVDPRVHSPSRRPTGPGRSRQELLGLTPRRFDSRPVHLTYSLVRGL